MRHNKRRQTVTLTERELFALRHAAYLTGFQDGQHNEAMIRDMLDKKQPRLSFIIDLYKNAQQEQLNRYTSLPLDLWGLTIETLRSVRCRPLSR